MEEKEEKAIRRGRSKGDVRCLHTDEDILYL